jgi:PAS domain S-box-containing protein
LAVQLKVNYYERTACTDQYFLYREERNRTLWLRTQAAAEGLLRQGLGQVKNPQDEHRLEQIQRHLQESAAIFMRLAGNSARLREPGPSQAVFEELDKRLASQLLVKAAVIRDTIRALQDAAESRVQRAYLRLVSIVGGFAAALALVIILASLQFRRLLSRGLAPLHAGVRTVADGDLEFRLEDGAQDEFGELAHAFNAMTARLQAFTRQLEAEVAERKLSEVLEEVDSYIYLKDLAGRYLFANRLAREILGCERDAILGQDDEAFFDPETLDGIRATDRRVLQGGETLRLEETVRNRRTGRSTTFWSVKHPLRDDAGMIYGLCGVSTDLTERKRMEAALNQAQKMQSLGSLAGGVAHDMNNVLGAILSLATAHLAIHPASSDTHLAFDTIATAAQRGGAMVRSLLSFARQTPAENLPLDLNELLTQEVRLLERTTLSRVHLEMDLAADLRRMRGDAGALAHAFMNLCVNAVDAMADQGILTLRTRNIGNDQLEVVVEDNGEGMPAEILEKAMDPFFTTKEQGKGTGLGLSMVYSTLMAHKGQMAIESEPGGGTRVLLRFPACTDDTQPLMQETEPAPAALGGPLKVFLVDDDELVQRSIDMLLVLMGHEPTMASSGEEALATLGAGYLPDVVILDLNMPGLGGAETLSRLRALHPRLPVLLATGRADQTALDLVAGHTLVTLLAKPFSMAELKLNLEPLRQG